ncbi:MULTISPECIES: YchJ family protein [Cetobacterium]|jgi:SEC-C motif-containing protein|uniref:YchJ family metal-binding protein n=1 Tax=Candidatus Cetobacterium colombiensis TaxID=3073100 RepID=A0ABU4WBE0_9FUSO|nr:YchJ family metal-binding protein [Candidatus Cetobacterium colombiensis]MDX8336470.1 YchJ family metal-binding protein [Candidatus Cetobacterium colombiensis]
MKNNFKTAEELMRARYNAFENGNIEFIVETHHPETKEDMDVEETRKWALNSEWLGLEIVSTEAGQEEDSEGIVEFKASYKENGELVVHHEKSKFVKKDGQWFYHGWLPLQGTIVKDEKIGRNDPCTCGSGKKYKKCCGK